MSMNTPHVSMWLWWCAVGLIHNSLDTYHYVLGPIFEEGGLGQQQSATSTIRFKSEECMVVRCWSRMMLLY